jgi:hypothetical membrane protein
VTFACVIIAASLSPWFSWTTNYISDLGGYRGDTPTWSVHGAASIILNLGVIIGGLMNVIFAFALRRERFVEKTFGRWGASLYLIDMLALTLVGVFPESTGAPHGIVAVVFFVLIPFELLFMGVGLAETTDEKRYAVLVLVLTLIAFISFPLLAAPRPFGSNAIAEIVPSVCIGAFGILFGMKLARSG